MALRAFAIIIDYPCPAKVTKLRLSFRFLVLYKRQPMCNCCRVAFVPLASKVGSESLPQKAWHKEYVANSEFFFMFMLPFYLLPFIFTFLCCLWRCLSTKNVAEKMHFFMVHGVMINGFAFIGSFHSLRWPFRPMIGARHGHCDFLA